jgi:hypothetical protein
VQLLNGSAFDIAKIPGGPNYRQFMRAARIPEGYRKYQYTALHNSGPNSNDRAPEAFLYLQSLRNYLPSWIPSWPPSWSGSGHKDHEHQNLVPILKALKAATESYLETSISSPEIVFSFPVTESYRNAVRHACSDLSLLQPMSAADPAGIFAARAQGVVGEEDTQQLVLTVDYSKAALTAMLVHEESRVFEVRRVLHSPNFGLDQLRAGSETDLNKMETALREMLQLPLNDGGNGEELKYINNLALLGEAAGNIQLHEVLKKVLDKHYRRLINSVAQRSSSPIDPLFAASRGVATDCLGRLNNEDDEL